MNSKSSILKKLRRLWKQARKALRNAKRPKPPQRAVQLEFGWSPRR